MIQPSAENQMAAEEVVPDRLRLIERLCNSKLCRQPAVSFMRRVKQYMPGGRAAVEARLYLIKNDLKSYYA